MSEPHAVPDVSPQLRALLDSLRQGGSPTAIVRQWQSGLRSADVNEVLRRAALTRRFDETLFPTLQVNLQAPPAFDEFVSLPEVRKLPRGAGYALREEARIPLLEEWPRDSTWREWNLTLASFVSAHDPGDVVSRLYYLLRADAGQARDLFEEAFASAERRFDLAHCFALLEVLTQAQKDLGIELAQSRELHQQRYRALAFISGDYYRTRTYQQRPGTLAAVDRVRQSNEQWILHLHATGGMGKTMFLRWFVTEQVLTRGVACARVDFDDVNTANVTRYPWLLLLPFAEQLNVQLPRRFFSELVDQLAPFAPLLWSASAPASTASTPTEPSTLSTLPVPDATASASYLKKFSAILQEANTPVMLVLDTLEGITMASEFAPVFGLLQTVQAASPDKTRAVLAGRYHIADKLAELDARARAAAGDTSGPPPALVRLLDDVREASVDLELTQFTDDEARQYLRSRGISDRPIIDAIVTKLREDETGATPGINPFTLSLFADVVLGRDAITVDEVRALPSAHFVYLVDRVIRRIAEQPLRWVVRYGALPRRLTPAFVNQVLLEPLRQALSGVDAGDRPAVQIRGKSEIREPDLWVADPNANVSTLWGDLCRYESPRGWIWRVPGTDAAVQFHGDVVDPMRDLLSSQPIFPVLQRGAIAHFETLAAPESSRWADWICEAIFHSFQLEGDAAVSYWDTRLKEARQKGVPGWRRQVAREVLRREYADDGIVPRLRGEPPLPLISTATLGRAHLETAWAILDEHGFVLPSVPDWDEFTRHITAVGQLLAERPPVADALVAHFAAATHVGRGEYAEAAAVLEQALAGAAAQNRFGLELFMAHVRSVLRDSRTPTHYSAAISAHPGPAVTRVPVADIHLALGHWYVTEGRADDATASFEKALASVPDTASAVSVRLTMAWEALRGADNRRVAAIAEEIRRDAPDHPKLRRLDAWIALATGRPQRAYALALAALSAASGPEEEAYTHDLLARIEAERMNFSAAFAAWDRATGLFNQTSAQNAVESCWFDRLVVEGRVVGNYAAAKSSLAQLQRMQGIRDAEIGCLVYIEQLFSHTVSGDAGAAAETFLRLRADRRPPWPPILRARVLCHGLALGAAEPDDATLDELATLIADVQPATARLTLFDAFRWRQRPLPAHLLPRILNCIAPVAPQDTPTALRLGELHRTFGAQAAVDFYVTALQESLRSGYCWGAIRACQASRRLGAPQAVTARLVEWYGTLALATFGEAALLLELVANRLDDGDVRGAQHVLDRTRPIIDAESTPTRWHATHAQMRARAALAQGDILRYRAQIQIAVDLWERLGDEQSASLARALWPVAAAESAPAPAPGASPEPGEAEPRFVVMRDTDALRDKLPSPDYDSLAELLLKDGDSFFSPLLPDAIAPGSLAAHHQGRLELEPGPLAALPWEWIYAPGSIYRAFPTHRGFTGSPVLWIQAALNRGGARLVVDGHWGPMTARALAAFQDQHGLPAEDPPGPDTFGALRAAATASVLKLGPILVLKPRGHYEPTFDVSHEGRAGIALERLYAQQVGHRQVQTVESPEWHQVGKWIATLQPTLVHIVCAVGEQHRLPCLSFDRGMQTTSNVITPRSFCDLVRGRGRPGPFVILDVARPSSNWDAVRCLLLRNHFAAEVNVAEDVSGVLATGLAQPWDVQSLADAITDHVAKGSSQQQLLMDIQHSGDGNDLDHRLAFAGTALFTSEPELPCTPL